MQSPVKAILYIYAGSAPTVLGHISHCSACHAMKDRSVLLFSLYKTKLWRDYGPGPQGVVRRTSMTFDSRTDMGLQPKPNAHSGAASSLQASAWQCCQHLWLLHCYYSSMHAPCSHSSAISGGFLIHGNESKHLTNGLKASQSKSRIASLALFASWKPWVKEKCLFCLSLCLHESPQDWWECTEAASCCKVRRKRSPQAQSPIIKQQLQLGKDTTEREVCHA